MRVTAGTSSTSATTCSKTAVFPGRQLEEAVVTAMQSAIDEEVAECALEVAVDELLRRMDEAEPRQLEAELNGQAFYFWTRINVLGRPVFRLNQRLVGSHDGVPVMIERQFYATQFLGAGQTVTALLPVDASTLVFYVNHSFVDRWSGPGFTAGAKRQVGQGIIAKILPKMAETLGLCEGRPS